MCVCVCVCVCVCHIHQREADWASGYRYGIAHHRSRFQDSVDKEHFLPSF